MSSKAFAPHKLSGLKRPLSALACLGAAILLSASQAMPDGRPTPSRQPVPRWLSLKSSEVRARFGPGLDYEIMWVYRARGLPVQVVAETREWRKVCDPNGSIAWIHRSVLSSNRRAYNATRQPLAVRASRSDTSAVRARLQPHAVTPLQDCEEGWCRVGGRRQGGWVRQSQIVGTASRPQCDASRPAGPGPGAEVAAPAPAPTRAPRS